MVCAFDASDLMSRLFMGDAHCRPGGLSLPHRIVVSEAEWKWYEVQAHVFFCISRVRLFIYRVLALYLSWLSRTDRVCFMLIVAVSPVSCTSWTCRLPIEFFIAVV